jgi:hypothetical protein
VERKITQHLKSMRIIIVAAMLSQTACHQDDKLASKFGESLNANRAAIGLPIVPSGWNARVNGKNVDFTNPHSNEGEPRRTYKRIEFRDDGSIVWEVDEFLSGKSFVTKDGEIKEGVLTYYFYPQKGTNDGHWKCEVISQEFSSEGTQKSLDLKDADKVLSKWGLSRTNDK